MRFLTILIISILAFQNSHSQINEIGIFLGGSNFIGDVGATNYISPKDPTFGLLYKWNASKRHSWRASLIYSDIKGDDKESDDPRRIQRGYNFNSRILEISAGIEFTFLDFDLHKGEKIGTPYLHTGITITQYDNFYFFNDEKINEPSNSLALGIPMTLGFKTNLLGHFILGAEVGVRYTFSDDIDGSDVVFGNINNNDWYTFSGITLTYTFGENACYCIN